MSTKLSLLKEHLDLRGQASRGQESGGRASRGQGSRDQDSGGQGSIDQAPLPLALALVGPSGSGKTSLLEQLIKILSQASIKVGAIKSHTKGSFDIDVPGKDSYRFTQAGSVHTLISAPGKIASVKQISHEPDFKELLAYMTDCQIVLAEGYRHAGLHTIELIRSGLEAPEDLSKRTSLFREETLAIASDYPEDALRAYSGDLTILDLNDPLGLIDFIYDRLVCDKK